MTINFPDDYDPTDFDSGARCMGVAILFSLVTLAMGLIAWGIVGWLAY